MSVIAAVAVVVEVLCLAFGRKIPFDAVGNPAELGLINSRQKTGDCQAGQLALAGLSPQPVSVSCRCRQYPGRRPVALPHSDAVVVRETAAAAAAACSVLVHATALLPSPCVDLCQKSVRQPVDISTA